MLSPQSSRDDGSHPRPRPGSHRPPETIDSIAVPFKGKIRLIPVGDIQRIEAAGHYLRIFTESAQYLKRGHMGDIAHQLGARRFFRVNRSTIVRSDEIVELEPIGRGDYMVVLRGGQRVRLGRSYKKSIARRILLL